MAVDVIVVGAGGGGPVVAKELAAQGLDVILLEAGPFYNDPETDWTHLENDANNPLTGYFRFGPGDRSQPAWYRETPQNSFLWQLSGVGGTTLHYYGNCPRAMPGVFMGYDGADAADYDPRVFPFTYEELIPYYEWVEATLPVQTAAEGTKEEVFFSGAATPGHPAQHQQERLTALVPGPGERHPPTGRDRRADDGAARPERRPRGAPAARSAATASRAARSRSARRSTRRRSARPSSPTSRWR